MFGVYLVLVTLNLFLKFSASQAETTSLKNLVFRKFNVVFVRKLTLLQTREAPAISFFSLKGDFLNLPITLPAFSSISNACPIAVHALFSHLHVYNSCLLCHANKDIFR